MSYALAAMRNAPPESSAALSSTAPTDEALRGQWGGFDSVSVLCLSLIALEISVLSVLRIAEADIYFHLRNAQELLTGHSFLHSDSYTFTSAGAPLVNFEWLSELPYYFAFRAWNLRGLLAVYMIALWIVFAAMYYLALRRGANSGDATMVTMAAVLLGSYSFGPRMFQFAWLCLAALLLALDHFERTGRGLWSLPLIFVLWINLHGSWVFGFVVLGIYIVSGTVQGQWNNVVARRWTPDELRKLLIACAASLVALFANPYGYKLVWYPFELLYRLSSIREVAPEWQSVDFHTFWGKLALLMLVALLLSIWFSPKPWPLRDVLLALFAVCMSLLHVRFLLFAAMVLVPILSPRLGMFAPGETQHHKPWLNLSLAVIVFGLIVWSYPRNTQLQKTIDTQFPHDALTFIQQRHITGRLLSWGGFSGYIEFFAPEVKTFADGRLDIFVYNGVLSDYLKINSIDSSFELLDKYKIDYVLYPVDRQLTYVLNHSVGWHVIYQDKVVKLFQRVPGGGGAATATP